MIKLANIKKKEAFDIYIGRENKWLNLPASKWANPFVLKRESEREEILIKVEEYFRNNPELIAALPELKNKTLGCYCFSSVTGEGKRCHGHILIKLYNEFVEKEVFCPDCKKEENFHFNYDYSKKEMPIIDVLCNECGKHFEF